MKRIAVILMCLVALCSYAQESYPEDLLTFEYPYFTTVTFQGASPGICDFVSSLINNEGMYMDSGSFIDAWGHYLRQEPQEPDSEIIVDKKNGYVYQASDYTYELEGLVHHEYGFYEMCYWNCADGKHKLFATTSNVMIDGRYIIAQTTGLDLYLYENARHIMWSVYKPGLGIDIEPDVEEGEEYPVVVYRLPKQGKDIIAEIHYTNRTDTVRLVWNGMMFKEQ